MYDNAGKKILGLAYTLCIIGIVISCICGLVMMISNSRLFLPGLLVAGIGSLGSWLGSLVLAAFGELVASTSEIRDMMAAGKMSSAAPSVTPSATPSVARSFAPPAAPSSAPYSQENIPTWKRIQMQENDQH